MDESISVAGERDSYWNSFYARPGIGSTKAPSQFAAFVAQEAGDFETILEVGCGGGRDSLFFARQGFAVIGLDASASAVALCRQLALQLGLENASFVQAHVGAPDFSTALAHAMPTRGGALCVYARFFLHAITSTEQTALLSSLQQLMNPGDLLAMEFRTTRDADLTKVTPGHFRRYVDPPSLMAEASRFGFYVDYAVEGFGFAKFRNDDAYVGRCLLRRNG